MSQDKQESSFGTRGGFSDLASEMQEKYKRQEENAKLEEGKFLKEYEGSLKEALSNMKVLDETKRNNYYEMSLMLLPPKFNAQKAFEAADLVLEIAKYNNSKGNKGNKEEIESKLQVLYHNATSGLNEQQKNTLGSKLIQIQKAFSSDNDDLLSQHKAKKETIFKKLGRTLLGLPESKKFEPIVLKPLDVQTANTRSEFNETLESFEASLPKDTSDSKSLSAQHQGRLARTTANKSRGRG